MNPPTATPRTDAEEKLAREKYESLREAGDPNFDDSPYFHARILETELADAKAECERLKFATEGHLLKTIQQQAELAAVKAECERLMNQRDNLLKPLRARAEDRADAADEKVERLTSENEKLTIERDALANGSAIEIARLRADLERFTGHGLLDCHAICDQRDAAVAERDQLRAEVERLKATLLSIEEDGTSEHNAAVGLRQNLVAAIARAERFEAERDAFAKDKARLDWLSVSDVWFDYPATGAFTPDTMRAAIDAAMKGTT